MKTRGGRAGHSLSPAAASLRLSALRRQGYGLRVTLNGLGRRRPGNPRATSGDLSRSGSGGFAPGSELSSGHNGHQLDI